MVESTGRFNNKDDAAKHIQAGARKVVLSAPAKGECMTVVMGVNEDQYDPSLHHVVSTLPAPPTAWPRLPKCSMKISESKMG